MRISAHRFTPSLTFFVTALMIAGAHALPATAAPVSAIAKANAKVVHEFDPRISASDISADVQVLASDAFGGRGPGTRGEEQTLDYLSSMLRQSGLQPGNGDSYFQRVPVIASAVDVTRSHMSLALPHTTKTLKFGDEVVYSSSAGQAEVTIKDSQVVFVGYGIDAPEEGWNDYANVDVHGKTVVILIGLPHGSAGAAFLSGTPGVSYYARSSYKYEEAARQGAAAAILIHDAQDAGFDWAYVRKRNSGRQFYLAPKDDPPPYPPVQAWISGDAAQSLFDSAGMSLRNLRDAAEHRDFKAMALGDAKLDATVESSTLAGESNNVIAKLPGTKYPGEAIVYSAHWDHFGTHPNERGDNIYHGALDNAIGAAAVLEIAAQFSAEDPKPERSVIFLMPTLEEQGLLGSRYYTMHPVIPLADTVADINFDVLVPVGLTRNFVESGLGKSQLDDWLKPIVQKQGRKLEGDPPDLSDAFFRSDHLSFARAGVPVLFLRGGSKTHDTGSDAQWRDFGNRYHTPRDKFDPNWDLRGAVQDLQIAYDVGKALADSHDWPDWNQGNQFRAIRDKQRRLADSQRH